MNTFTAYNHSCRRDFFSVSVFLKITVLVIVLVQIPSAHGKLTIEKECGENKCDPHYYCSSVDHFCRPCQVVCDPVLGNFDKDVCERDCQDYLHDLWYLRKSELFFQIQDDLKLLKILIGIVIILSTVVVLALFAIMIYFKRVRNQIKMNQTTPVTQLASGGDSTAGNSFFRKFQKKKNLNELPVIYSNDRILSLPINHDFAIRGPASHKSGSLNNNLSRGSTPDLVSRSVPSLLNSTSLTSEHEKVGSGSLGGSKGGDNKSMTMLTRYRREPSESTLPEYAFDNPALVPSPTHNMHM